MEDKLGKAANLPAEDSVDTTTINFGLAEPGHDVFGGKEDSKSQAKEPVGEPGEAQEKKEISIVTTAQATTAGTQEAASEVTDDTASIAEDSNEAQAPTADSQDETEKKETTPEEAEAEADRARNELFPEGR